MTGREKIERAFSPGGTPSIPAVICYEGIYIRDHWQELTSLPWWACWSPELDQQMAWRREAIQKTGQDWFALPLWYSREERENLALEVRGRSIYLVDGRTGATTRLEEPRVGGWTSQSELESYHPECSPESPAEIDSAIPLPASEPEEVLRDGRSDLARALLSEFGGELFPLSSVGAPLWRSYRLWGFEGMMTKIATQPELVKYACERFLAQALHQVEEAAHLGAKGIWVEDCMTDLISPASFRELNRPYVKRLSRAIQAAGMRSIYYYCGDPATRWEEILSIEADALSFEESKKRFRIEIEEVLERVGGRAVVLGNLDAIGILPDGTEEELRREIARQLAAARRHGGRFIMSLGSPVTPGTPVARVRRYCDLVRELGG